MKTATKIWLSAATSLAVLGVIVMIGAMVAMKWDFKKLSTVKYETNAYEISDPFENISIDTKTADVRILISDDQNCRVVCYEETKVNHRVEVLDGTLTIKAEDTRKWYDYISPFSFENAAIAVYVPRTEYESLSIDVSTGDVEISEKITVECVEVTTTTGSISVKDLTAGQMKLTVSTGKVRVSDVSCTGDVSVRVSTGKAFLTDVSCENLYSKGTTGDLNLRRVVASKAFSVERDTGDVEFDRCDASEIFVKTDTGEVEGSLLTEKIFFVKTGTGDVDVPRTTTGGRCEITTDTGDIEIELVR